MEGSNDYGAFDACGSMKEMISLINKQKRAYYMLGARGLLTEPVSSPNKPFICAHVLRLTFHNFHLIKTANTITTQLSAFGRAELPSKPAS